MSAADDRSAAGVAPAPTLMVSIDDAQRMLGGVSRSTIYELEKQGHVQFVKLGSRSMIPVRMLEKMVASMVGEATIKSARPPTAPIEPEPKTETKPAAAAQAKKPRAPRKPAAEAAPAPTGVNQAHQSAAPASSVTDEMPAWEGPSEFADDDIEMGDPDDEMPRMEEY